MILLLAGCLTLDANVYNPIPCDAVGPSTCEEVESPWNRVCATCETPYDWTEEHPWFEGMLAEGQTIRPIEEVQRVVIASDDGRADLDAYWIPSHGEDPDRSAITVLYSHGNFAGIEHYRPRVRVLHELGFNVFVWDYRGYGKSTPNRPPTPEELLADARQVRDHLGLLAPDPERILAYGYSLGAISAVEQATTGSVCGLVLESPFTSMERIASSNTGLGVPETHLSEGRFDNLRKLQGHVGPVLAMVGREDELFPPEDVQRLVDGVVGPTRFWVVDGAAHGIESIGIVEHGVEAYDSMLATFLSDSGVGCAP